jgi:hypothetical protein
MAMLSNTTMRYQIIVRGECGMLLAGIVDDLTAESSHGRTRIVISVRDESELYGLLDRLQDLAVHIISLNELSADP